VSERKGGASGPKSGGKGGKPEAAKGASAKASAPVKGAGGKPAAAKAEPKGSEQRAAEQKAAEQKVAEPKASEPKAAAAAPEGPGGAPAVKKAFKRTLIGRVKSDKMDKTVVVEVVRSKMDPVYKKYVRVRKSYQAHDEENAYKVGDRVEIIEHRPISRFKRWKVINLVERAVQE